MTPSFPPLVGASRVVAAHVRSTLSVSLAQLKASDDRAWLNRLGISVSKTDRLPREAGIAEQKAISKYASKLGLSLEDIVRQRRGEVGADTRPNKGLDPDRLSQLLQGYPFVDMLVEIARHGIRPSWKSPGPQSQRPPKNHSSAKLFLPALLKSIRQGQASGTYLVVDKSMLHHWTGVQCSPFGAVEKKGVDPREEIRPIHDLSYPESTSTNDYFDFDCAPEISYICVVAIARRIEYLSQAHPDVAIKILKGDVKSAFRHLMVHANHVRWMGATIPEVEVLVIDLAAPFGWSGSPAFYSSFGRAISWLVSSNSPATMSESSDDEPFFGYEWVDDHILVEPDRDNRLELAETTLRLSMMAVLGPESINDNKFSCWSTELQALGLIWNTEDRTVSIPPDKISKCLDRVSIILAQEKSNKLQLQKLLGSLRHLTTCLRSVKPFFQKLHALCSRLHPFQAVRLDEASRRDLQWLHHILSFGHLEKMPLRFFGTLPAPNINLYMDASDTGLVVLNPTVDEFIQIRFDADEIRLIQTSETSGFTINVREHLCMALAAWCWGPQWQQTLSFPHIVCWSDNVSAVSWINSLHSLNEFSQEVNRGIGLAEALFNIRLSAQHLPGSCNRMADAGSRAWSPLYSRLWSELSSSWRQVQVPERWRRIYKEFSAICSPAHWPRRPSSATALRGSSGAIGASTWSTVTGYPTNPLSRPDNSCSSQSTATDTGREPNHPKETIYKPSSPRSARLRGIIGGNMASTSTSSRTTPWQSEAFPGSSHPPNPSSPSHWSSSGVSTSSSTSTKPTTVSYGGLRSWASSFY